MSFHLLLLLACCAGVVGFCLDGQQMLQGAELSCLSALTSQEAQVPSSATARAAAASPASAQQGPRPWQRGATTAAAGQPSSAPSTWQGPWPRQRDPTTAPSDDPASAPTGSRPSRPRQMRRRAVLHRLAGEHGPSRAVLCRAGQSGLLCAQCASAPTHRASAPAALRHRRASGARTRSAGRPR